MKNPSLFRKASASAIVLLICAYAYMAHDHYQFNKNMSDLEEARHNLLIATQKMEDWKNCTASLKEESFFMCNATIGYPQDLIRDFQNQRELVFSLINAIGDHSE